MPIRSANNGRLPHTRRKFLHLVRHLPDWAVAQIGDRDTGEQCATLRLRCMPAEFGRYVYKLARFYQNAQVALERTGAGVGSLEALVNCGYPTGLIYYRTVMPESRPGDPLRQDRMEHRRGFARAVGVLAR